MQALVISVVLFILFLGYCLVRLCEVIGKGMDKLSEIQNNSIKKRQEARKNILRNFVTWDIPSGLQNLEASVHAKEHELERAETRKPPVILPRKWIRHEFEPLKFGKHRAIREMLITDCRAILSPNQELWSEEITASLRASCKYPSELPELEDNDGLQFIEQGDAHIESATFSYDFDRQPASSDEINTLFAQEQQQVISFNQTREFWMRKMNTINIFISVCNQETQQKRAAYQEGLQKQRKKEVEKFEAEAAEYEQACSGQKELLRKLSSEYKKRSKVGVETYFQTLISWIELPQSLPIDCCVEYDKSEGILVVEVRLPDVISHPPKKIVKLKKGDVEKPLSKKECGELVPSIHPSILLRMAYEIARNDTAKAVKFLAISGWISYDDPRTGKPTKAYTASLGVKPDDVLNLNLLRIDPLAAFDNLKGVSAGKIMEIIPINPVLKMSTKDSRFVEAKAVIGELDAKTNLAAMDWQDFEHLIRELFEKMFEKRGAEVKITQASRDRGVDAIVFDPDPITGGKFVIQAKRYAHTVDVSAVRDLYAVVQKEGASRGILVTTSNYGADAHEFVRNTPITLMNGAELLGLLKQYGYTFRIDLAEARKLNREWQDWKSHTNDS